MTKTYNWGSEKWSALFQPIGQGSGRVPYIFSFRTLGLRVLSFSLVSETQESLYLLFFVFM